MIWNHFLTYALRFCTLVPWLCLASIYSVGLRTAYAVGHLPRCNLDNSPDEWFCHALFWIGFNLISASMASPAFVALLLGLNQMRARRDDWRVHIGVHTLGWAAIFFLLIVDPGGIMEWWFD
ncbi:MAG: hypothetical protein H7145_04730 [Akkermansiaceae bacterium]|nr:hypothetical protein [Armatimonadota bacterium]